MRLAASLTIAALALAALASGARAQAPDSVPVFEQTEVMIPMRDGVKLHTLMFAPKGATEPLPLLLIRTPYGIEGSLKRNRAELRRAGAPTDTSSCCRTFAAATGARASS